jgi:hypothetical protein
MEDEGCILAGELTILAGQQVSFHQFDLSALRPSLDDSVQSTEVAGWPNQTDHVSEPTIQQAFQNPCTDKASRPGYKHSLIRSDYRISRLICRRVFISLHSTFFVGGSRVNHRKPPTFLYKIP